MGDLLKDALFSASIGVAGDGAFEGGVGAGVGVGVGRDERSFVAPHATLYGTPYHTPGNGNGSAAKRDISMALASGGSPPPTATPFPSLTPLRGVTAGMIRYYLIDHGLRVPLHAPEPRALALALRGGSPSPPPSSRLSSRPSSPSQPPRQASSPSLSPSQQQQQQPQPQALPLSQLLSLPPGNYKFVAVFEPGDAQWRGLDSAGNTPFHTYHDT